MSLLSFRPGRVGGAETYVRQLVAELPGVAGGDQLLLLADRDLARDLTAPGWEIMVAPRGARAVVAERVLEAYTPWRARTLQRFLDRARPDVAFFPQQSIFPIDVRIPAVVTVGDVQHLYLPGNFGLFDRTFRARAYPRSLSRARRVIAVSEFTRRSLVERSAVQPGKITVVPHGVLAEPPPGPVRPAPVESPFLYYPAASYPHKDHETLFRSYAALRRCGALAERLVLTGERTSYWSRRLQPLLLELGLERDVTHLGFVARDDLAALYGGATAVVFPSRFEGFGLPVVEACRHGARLVTSRLEVFDEIGVPRQNQIDFSDPEALAAALRLPAPTKLERTPLTWRECAELTMDVLRAAAS
jgi:glycosyltransferase involved in cell wall biosynthesis